MRRPARIALWVVGVLLALMLLSIGTVLVAGNTDAGRAMIEQVTDRLTGGQVKLSGLGGSFPSQVTLKQLQLTDGKGAWLTAEDVSLRWSPLRLLERRIVADSLHVARLNFERLPISQSSGGGSASVPDIEVGHFAIDALELGADLAGTPAVLAAQGNLHLRSLQDADANVEAHRTGGEGDYSVHLHFDSARMDATLAVSEPANGPLQNLVRLPGLGALSAQLKLEGPRNAERVDAAITAGALQASARGTVDLTHAAADLDYTIDSAAMAPRPDLSWSRIALHGNWHGPLSAPSADGKLEVERLVIADGTKIADVNADLSAADGTVGLKALVKGLEIPGSASRILAEDPIELSASMRTGDASRPLQLTATHRLATLRATVITAGDQRADVDLRLSDLAPLARMAGQDVRGTAVLEGHLQRKGSDATLDLDANFGFTGGSAGWLGVVGPHATAQIAATLSADSVSVQNLKVAGVAVTMTANASAGLALPHMLQARWQLAISDLTALSPDLAGKLQLSGSLKGAPGSMTGDANLTTNLSVHGSPLGEIEASLHARGLPSLPSGSIEAHGTLDGAPLKVDVAVERTASGSLRALVHQARWKSAGLDGDLSVNSGLTMSHGQLALHVAQLGDFDRLLGVHIDGSLEGTLGFDPAPGQPHARLKLDATQLAYGGIVSGGEIHLQGAGPADALNIDVAAALAQLYGKPAKLSATALLDLHASTLHIASASTEYRGGAVRLLEPAQLAFAKGFSVETFRLGSQGAVFQVQGQLSPELDLRVSLQHVSADLVNTYVPALLAGGALDAQAQLQGTFAAPIGTLQIDATKIAFADDAATGLPPADIHGSAQLQGLSASVDVTLAAGGSSQLKLSGTAPLSSDGALDLKIGGKLDVGLANPLLEARGLHATGELTVDAGVGGTVGAPQVGGGVSLASGSLRDYGRGINLSNITAEAVGSEGTLQIKSFKATAASGSVSVAGSIGVLQANIPVDLKITAKNAQPISSNIVTANLDADIHVSGTARKRLDVGGTIHVIHAVIGIPNSLPPDVAVLDVRRRGQAPIQNDQQLVIGLDVSIHAPVDILVQGRGLDAEMGGDLHIGGTSDDPTVGGGFDLQRGSFTLGTKLNFPSGYSQRVSFDSAGLRKKIDPTLDFTAQAVFGENTISVHISGAADAPRFDLSSSTGQQQDEIMAMLLFNGENAASITALQAAQIAATLATLSGVGSGGGPNPFVKLQRSLGLDRLNVGSNTTTSATGATESAGAAIEAGRYVSKRVYVEGKQTTTGTSQVQVDVDLTKHLKLQTRLGNGTATTQGTTPENDPGSSVGISYQFEY